MHNERGTRRDLTILAVLALGTSIGAFLHYYRNHEILLYGDALAHINIARRVFDSITPGPLQLGTVWLPLPHLLMIPFLISNWMWKTGIGGSVVSMAAYILGTIGVYTLARDVTPVNGNSARAAAWLAAAAYAANPNLIYLQATAMTESLYMALFVWVAVFANESLQTRDSVVAAKSMDRCALALAAAMLTRYDGWFLAAGVILMVVSLKVVVPLWRAGETAHTHRADACFTIRLAKRSFLELALMLVAVAGLWFAYNYREFGNPAEFLTGPYSAHSIAYRTADPRNPHHPGDNTLIVASQYFLKSVKLNLGGGPWELPLFCAALLGLFVTLTTRTTSAALLLWLPLPFYALSIAYGDVPVFLPVWWPFSYYNVRYGLELLPAVAVFTGILVAAALQHIFSGRLRLALGLAAAILLAGSYVSVWRSIPICLREAHANGDTRQRFESALARELQSLPSSSQLLMSTGDHPGALERAGIPLRHTINETNHPQWEQALAHPARAADYVIALDDDDVAQAVSAHAQNLSRLDAIKLPGAPRTTIYKSSLRGSP